MKKLVAITIIAGLLMGLASVAMAAGTATNWAVLLRGSDANYQNFAGLIQIGTDAAKSDAKDTTDSKIIGNSGSQAQVAVLQPTWGDTPPLYNQDKRAPITDAVKSWTLVFWVGPAYTGSTARLAYWSTSNLSPIATAANWAYEFEIVSDPTETYAAGTKWAFTPGATGTSIAPVGFKDFSNVAAIKTSDTGAPAAGVVIKFTAGPVPEPSSMVALASGLFGLAGVAIRRRK